MMVNNIVTVNLTVHLILQQIFPQTLRSGYYVLLVSSYIPSSTCNMYIHNIKYISTSSANFSKCRSSHVVSGRVTTWFQ